MVVEVNGDGVMHFENRHVMEKSKPKSKVFKTDAGIATIAAMCSNIAQKILWLHCRRRKWEGQCI